MEQSIGRIVVALVIFIGCGPAIGDTGRLCGQCQILVEENCIDCKELEQECQTGKCMCHDYPREMISLLRLAVSGEARAQNRLCHIYYFGSTVPKNCSEAAKWCRRAAEQEQLSSQSTLGHLYFDGCGAEQNTEEGLRWLRLAASKGNAPAAWYLGFCYRTGGKGLRANEGQALKWFEVGARQGHVPSMECYYGQPFDLLDLETEAKQKNIKAQSFLGLQIYNKAHFNPSLSDDEKSILYRNAANWLSRAADRGDANSQYVLATMYIDGNGIGRDLQKGLELMKKAASGGNPFARDFIKGADISR